MLVVTHANADAMARALAPAGTIRKTCSECQGAGQCIWQTRITRERSLHPCLGCNGVGHKSVKDFSHTPELPSLAAVAPPALQEVVGVTLPSAFPSFPVNVVLSRGQTEPYRQEELHAIAKSRLRSVPRSLSPEIASERLQAILEAAPSVDAVVQQDQPTEAHVAEQAGAPVVEDAEEMVVLSDSEGEEPERELTAQEKAKIIKRKRRCPGCFVSEAEDPVHHDQPLIDHYLSDMHPSQHYHMEPGGCMSGDPVSSDEEGEEGDDDESPPSKKAKVADEGCAGGCVMASLYRALSGNHPYNCVNCGKHMTFGEVSEQGLENLGVDSSQFD